MKASKVILILLFGLYSILAHSYTHEDIEKAIPNYGKIINLWEYTESESKCISKMVGDLVYNFSNCRIPTISELEKEVSHFKLEMNRRKNIIINRLDYLLTTAQEVRGLARDENQDSNFAIYINFVADSLLHTYKYRMQDAELFSKGSPLIADLKKIQDKILYYNGKIQRSKDPEYTKVLRSEKKRDVLKMVYEREINFSLPLRVNGPLLHFIDDKNYYKSILVSDVSAFSSYLSHLEKNNPKILDDIEAIVGLDKSGGINTSSLRGVNSLEKRISFEQLSYFDKHLGKKDCSLLNVADLGRIKLDSRVHVKKVKGLPFEKPLARPVLVEYKRRTLYLLQDAHVVKSLINGRLNVKCRRKWFNYSEDDLFKMIEFNPSTYTIVIPYNNPYPLKQHWGDQTYATKKKGFIGILRDNERRVLSSQE